MIDDRTIQQALAEAGHYHALIDGDYGRKSKKAAREAVDEAIDRDIGEWSDARIKIAWQQLMMLKAGIEVGDVDGLIGPQTLFALEMWQNMQRDIEPLDDASTEALAQSPKWPKQRDVPLFYGKVGANQTLLKSPYPMKLAWDKTTVIRKFSVHEKVHDSMLRVLKRALEHYGQEEIERLNLDQFGGCLNVRKMRGGSKFSMHSWGIAIDIDPANNRLRWGKDRAHMARRDRLPFVKLWEEEGWVSLGRERNFDWMHFQAARL